ncbi:TetR family transcriptional regulator C-terminal domain-containing protein [Tenacibaculum sp. nBUS_03]|uniref:TetR family transcriptional regulator C-terminal domain-containing protein n=1 Tax=Tenacibaculum sp. nBUS_03 TaxID=3395320 RepID=UPI003EBC4C29
MARKKNITSDKIIELYMDQVLMGNNTPHTIYAFSKNNDFDESDFYKFFNSFETLEKKVFAIFCSKTVQLLLQNDDYKTYDAKSKLLSFYYTFFELLSANRSYVILKLKQNKNKLESLKLLSKLRKEFQDYISAEIHTDKIDFKNKTVNKIQDKGFLEASWMHLLFTLQFWLDDQSENFEKTDIFIEKSVKASFDLRDITPLQSVFDFAKFLWKEKMPSV